MCGGSVQGTLHRLRMHGGNMGICEFEMNSRVDDELAQKMCLGN